MFWKQGPVVVALIGAALLVSSCAVGPNFAAPAVPEASRYTKEPLATRTSSADVRGGQAQRFINGRDISGDWWNLFRSPALDSLVQQSLHANPTLQSAIAAVRGTTLPEIDRAPPTAPTAIATGNNTAQRAAPDFAPVAPDQLRWREANHQLLLRE